MMFIEVGENKLGVLIGDVADKGVPSAIFMARAHALIIAEADDATLPGEVLRMANKHITRLEKSTQFVTALYGVLDTETGEFSYARAGHEPPLLMTRSGEVRRLPHKPGMALGLWEDIALDEYSLTLPKDSLLVLFTDGMTDDCGAVFHAGRWQWLDKPKGAHEERCPACHRAHDRFPAGFVSLSGDFLASHEQEIKQLIRHVEAKEKAAHPLQRIMAIEKTKDGTVVTTTDIHLARGIGDALHHAYRGELEFHYSPEQNLLRVGWVH